MKLIGTILWLVFTGFVSAIAWVFIGVLWCITIVGIPFGLQAFKLARVSLWPFGTTVRTNFDKHPVANLIWIVLGGVELSISFLLAGLIWCITIIGIPFGKQCFKMARLSLIPFGATVK